MRMRQQQNEAFSEAAVKDFENRMVVHLHEFFPEQCKALGEKKTRKAIREGIERAGKYDIVTERDVCKFIDLMFAFGRKFDQDRKYPWARDILNDPAIDDPTTKAEGLYDAGLYHVRQAAGNDIRTEP